MSMDIFLKLDDVKGESTDKSHKDEIDIMSFSWGMAQSGTTHMGGGGGAGKVSVQDISITKFHDKASPLLSIACCTGKHYKQGLITFRKAGEKPLEYLKLKLEEVMITSVSHGGSGGDDRPTETVTLNFAKFTHTYTPQKPDGSGDAPVEQIFNIAENNKE